MGLTKDNLGEEIIKIYLGLRPKMYSYQKVIAKKKKATDKKIVIKRKIKFESF